MANDNALWFHGTLAAGSTMTFTAASTPGPTVDLGSSTVNRTILVERRIGSISGSTLGIAFVDSLDNSTFSAMPGVTGAGFKPAASSNYASTDALAPTAPERIVFKTDKRYVRALFTIGTSGTTVGGVSVVGKVLTGAYSGAVGPLDV